VSHPSSMGPSLVVLKSPTKARKNPRKIVESTQQNRLETLSELEDQEDKVILASSGIGITRKKQPSVQAAPRPQSKKATVIMKHEKRKESCSKYQRKKTSTFMIHDRKIWNPLKKRKLHSQMLNTTQKTESIGKEGQEDKPSEKNLPRRSGRKEQELLGKNRLTKTFRWDHSKLCLI
jgi:hypothetical protein